MIDLTEKFLLNACINAIEDYVSELEHRVAELESLVRDMRLTPAEYVRKRCVTDDVKGSDAYWWMYESVGERMAALGLFGGDAE